MHIITYPCTLRFSNVTLEKQENLGKLTRLKQHTLTPRPYKLDTEITQEHSYSTTDCRSHAIVMYAHAMRI